MSGICMITGGSRGIGAATAIMAASHGWDVAITYRRRADEADRVLASCLEHGVRASAHQGDVADERDVRRVFSEVTAELGPVTAVINNAGVVPTAGRVDTYDTERMLDLLKINVVGAFLVAGEAVRRMSTAHGGDGGVIVNVSSRAALLGGPGEYVDYAGSKAAIDALTVGLALEVAAEGVRVVGVRPGLIDTEIHAPGRLERIGSSPPLGRPGSADEVAAAIVWLMSDEASYVTGASLDIGGGR